MKLSSPSFPEGQLIPAEYALCTPAPGAHLTLAPNRNPTLIWSDPPEGTRSLVLICYDPDAPTNLDDINQEGRTIPAAQARGRFYHWVLVDLPPELGAIRAGEFSEGMSRHDKQAPETRHGARQGLNSYNEWFARDPEMAGKYFGYDGPCPPWNDTRVHRYIFTLYALDLERCPVEGEFRAAEVLAAIDGHVLATASITGLYSMNPTVKP
ncbi:MAG: YbhB/YbcL family Raf kinase inhibitor-like protein [Candidatus Competibacteraceae bacterium]